VLTDSEVEQIAAGVGIGSSWTDYSGANAYRVHKAAGDGMVATLAELNRAGLVCDGNLSEIAIPIDMAWVNEDKLTSERQFGKRTVYVYPVSEFRPSGVHNEPERVAAGATASQQAYFNRCSAYYRGLQTRCFNYERESYEREIEREMWRADDDNAQVVVTGGGYDSIYPELSELF
jgi:hypothetical protein